MPPEIRTRPSRKSVAAAPARTAPMSLVASQVFDGTIGDDARSAANSPKAVVSASITPKVTERFIAVSPRYLKAHVRRQTHDERSRLRNSDCERALSAEASALPLLGSDR